MTCVSLDQIVLPHARKLCFAGAVCDLHTDSAELTATLETLSVSVGTLCSGAFRMRVVVDDSSSQTIGEPHFRGLHHVVIASFGIANVFVFDILRRTLNASVTTEVARDERFWKEKLIPITLGVLGAAMGLVPMHCACLESEGDGLLIAGISGAGKSTLSVALSEQYFNYVSDDWTYISHGRGRIVAHGMSAPVKLLPDAVKHFPVLQRYNIQTSMNGELAYEVDVAETFGAQLKRECQPRWLVFLERMPRAGSEFTPMSSAEALKYLDSSVEKLPKQLSQAAVMREKTIHSIAQLPCWRFGYGGTPQFAATKLHEFVLDRKPGVRV